MTTILVWFRRDLRLSDNEALRSAMEQADTVIPVFIWAPNEESPWEPGAASCWWLHHSLETLIEQLTHKDARLILRQGDTQSELKKLISETKATGVYWNRLYDPKIIERDKLVKKMLKDEGLDARSFAGSVLAEPWTIENTSGGPYQVFTPFWKKLHANFVESPPVATPQSIDAPTKLPSSLKVEELKLLPRIDWTTGIEERWTPGEAGAKALLKEFLSKGASDYKELRDRCDLSVTSSLSPHLHFGEISARQIWHEVDKAINKKKLSANEGLPFLRQLGWRDFANHLLYHFPKTDLEPLRPEFAKFPWKKNKKSLTRWQEGRTGYPLVDAGMRELWQTGTMHNRVRMVVASFLVKDLLLPWQEGARWFWDTLVDADLANNTLGWQWTAGCGADAAPYFRVFNPIRQGERFDPEGAYVRRYIPELAKLPKKWIHKPWEAPQHVLEEAGVELGNSYPEPIVNHSQARDIALEAYDQIKKKAA